MLTAELCETLEKIGLGERWRKEGIEKGIERGKLEDAQALLAEGDSLEKIARVTRLPLEMLKEKFVH